MREYRDELTAAQERIAQLEEADIVRRELHARRARVALERQRSALEAPRPRLDAAARGIAKYAVLLAIVFSALAARLRIDEPLPWTLVPFLLASGAALCSAAWLMVSHARRLRHSKEMVRIDEALEQLESAPIRIAPIDLAEAHARIEELEQDAQDDAVIEHDAEIEIAANQKS